MFEHCLLRGNTIKLISNAAMIKSRTHKWNKRTPENVDRKHYDK